MTEKTAQNTTKAVGDALADVTANLDKMKIEEDPSVLARRVFVGNMTYQTRDIELKEFCEKVGPV